MTWRRPQRGSAALLRLRPCTAGLLGVALVVAAAVAAEELPCVDEFDAFEEEVEGVALLQHQLELEHMQPKQPKVDLVHLQEQQPTYEHPPWLQQCTQIYLDVGSNIGVQVRKLFEPEKFPGATILPLFEQKFGPAEVRRRNGTVSGLCALGFEPNPNWEGELKNLTSEFAAKGFRVHFYPYAVAGSEGTATFQVSDSDNLKDWDAMVTGLAQVKTAHKARNITVRKIDFVQFISELPWSPHDNDPMVKLMKMDIEGSEWDVLARMLPANALCTDRIEEAFIETHEKGDATAWGGNRTYCEVAERLLKQECRAGSGITKMSDLDDETYLDGVHYDWKAAWVEDEEEPVATTKEPAATTTTPSSARPMSSAVSLWLACMTLAAAAV